MNRFARYSMLTFVVSITALRSASAISVNTSGVYDSTMTNPNQVDRVAVGDLTTFTSNMATAFSNNQGGVITYDGGGTTSSITTGLQASFGFSLSKTLTITPSNTFNIQFSSNIRAISGNENSGTGLFALDLDNNKTTTYTFGAITGGAANEKVTQAGFTVLTRNGGGAPTITVTALFSGGGTASGAANFTVTTTPDQDTFYGFTAPAGQSITSISIDYGASGDFRRGIDDFGFITSVVTPVPEPGTYLAGLMISTIALIHLVRRFRLV